MNEFLPNNSTIADLFFRKHEQGLMTDEYDRVIVAPHINYAVPQVTNYLRDIKKRPPILWPNNAPYALCLTHDVDQITTYWKKFVRRYSVYPHRYSVRGLAAIKDYVIQQVHNEYLFNRILGIERTYGATSTFFFMATIDADTRYNIEQQKNILQTLQKNGNEIALHAGMHSYKQESVIAEEKKRLENVIQEPIVGIRQHYLRLDSTATWKYQKEVGLQYDSTLGFNNQVGFRNGVAEPYYIFSKQHSLEHRFIEIPLMIMDAALYKQAGANSNERWQLCRQLLDTLREVQGAASLLWHIDQFNDALWPGSTALYTKILAYAASQGAWLTSGRNIITYLKETDQLDLIDYQEFLRT